VKSQLGGWHGGIHLIAGGMLGNVRMPTSQSHSKVGSNQVILETLEKVVE